jgi:hypothetical protein
VIKGLPNPGCQFFSLARGDMMPLGWIALGVARLPTDPVGTFTLRLKNIVRGSRYRIEVATTGALADTDGEGDAPAGTGTTTDVDITLPYYASGNANNDLRIKVRKGRLLHRPALSSATSARRLTQSRKGAASWPG